MSHRRRDDSSSSESSGRHRRPLGSTFGGATDPVAVAREHLGAADGGPVEPVVATPAPAYAHPGPVFTDPATDDTVQFAAVRDDVVETPTQQIPVLRLSDKHEELLDRLRARSQGAPEPARSSGSGRHLVRRALMVAAAFLVVLCAGTAAVAGLAYKKYNGQIKRVAVLQTTDPNIVEPAKQQNAENFLIIGSDHRASDDPGYGDVVGARSDTTIVVHLSPDHEKATVVSIPRDSFVDIPDCKGSNGQVVPAHQELFNSAFSEGGPACTIATVQKLTGIAITHFVEVDFDGFQKMVSAMGTVNICSPEAVYDHDSGLRLKQGMNPLNGTQALAYVRARHNLGDGSDLGRIKRQQMFMSAVLRQAMHGDLLSNPVHLTKFLDAATKSITVDKGTTFGDLRTLANSMQGLDPAHVLFYTAPIANSDYSPPGFNYTGKVLLDPVAGKILYDSVINDSTPVWVTPSGTTSSAAGTPTAPTAPAGSTSAATSADAPKPNTNGASTSCSI